MEEEVYLPNWTEVQFQVFPNTFWLTTLKSFSVLPPILTYLVIKISRKCLPVKGVVRGRGA